MAIVQLDPNLTALHGRVGDVVYKTCRDKSFHHMGVYVRPELLPDVSKTLRARMQGKSCFNFTSVDKALFGELEELTVRGFEAFRKAGLMP